LAQLYLQNYFGKIRFLHGVGVPLEDAQRIATRDPARLMGRDIGQMHGAKLADLDGKSASGAS